mmetsp:Transcript_27946/g.26993  ORF Transcript_27946/g.26993 Transcript_27946/m.26993 type:complete len:92 (+) Transcript_27946:430-705(+)|eukprot:CAMPEP_0170555654 /NCGR_PEP_ID=MMETSP0211-20121228/13522_1 /TAXON_ID=311385 /ORGANISM="Pseudokeronopsis sp., Strain OXSARD2" /LENGTH=91 /DNA_ID=CAMNT_0010865607 /DNA_START=562 /DNA_END=837 /DNA_ORIENTATION=+
MNLSENVDFDELVKLIPRNFTGADFNALCTESFMLAAKDKIEIIQLEMKEYQEEQKIDQKEENEMMVETFLKLKYCDDEQAQEEKAKVFVE